MKHILALLALAASLIITSNARTEETVESWLHAATEKWTPAAALKKPISKREESLDEARARRSKIVREVLDAASDESMPSLFPNAKNGRVLSALFVLAVWRYESHYDLRVQSYHCEGLPKGSCDDGLAWCLGQIHVADVPQLTERGWTGEDLQADLGKCARATLWRLDAARTMCTAMQLEGGDRFGQYATGKCGPSVDMRARYRLATSWVEQHPAPVVGS